MALSPEQSKVFDAYDRMFATDGWRELVSEIKQNQDALKHIILAPESTRDTLWFCKGRNDVYKFLLGLQSLMEQARKAAEEPDYE